MYCNDNFVSLNVFFYKLGYENCLLHSEHLHTSFFFDNFTCANLSCNIWLMCKMFFACVILKIVLKSFVFGQIWWLGGSYSYLDGSMFELAILIMHHILCFCKLYSLFYFIIFPKKRTSLFIFFTEIKIQDTYFVHNIKKFKTLISYTIT